ncbi:MAG: asparagine synthase (glutamine-hydrolyzing) [Vicinamibacterales bacterium]
MCGIAGIVTADGSTPDVRQLRAMTDTLVHRGPDGEGHRAMPGCGLGHRRLSIVDLAGGAQPMADEHERCWITFNGEIYNFQELRARLESGGHRFRTRSDTEALVHLVEEKWTAALPELNGMFAFGLWDSHSRRLLLARDRIGKKPLYWFRDSDGLYFASEIKALLTLPNCPREVDPDSLDLYLAYAAVPGTTTIFKHIFRLPPASALTWSPGTEPRIETYWTARWQPKTSLTYDEAQHHLRDLIGQATRARLIADVPLGAFLSGGVDSSVVVAAMAESSTRVKTFSIGFARQQFDERRYARMVADRFGTDHEEFVVEPDTVDILPKLAWHYDQPFADSSALPTYQVSRLTRQRVTVALTGDGGDEMFGGYERYRALVVQAAYRALTTPGLRDLAERLTCWLPEGSKRHSWLRQVRRFTHAARQEPDAFNLHLFTQREFVAGDRQALYTSAFAGRLRDANADRYLLDLMAASAAETGPDPVDRALRTDTLMYLPDTLLVKVDIASMAASLEARAPLLDVAVMEFAASLPRAWKVTSTENKKILKSAYRDIVPRDALYRRKMGFSIPLAEWLRQELYGYLRDVLLDSATLERGYFRREAVERLIEDHRSGRRNNASRLWALLMLEHWHREILGVRQPLAAARA